MKFKYQAGFIASALVVSLLITLCVVTFLIAPPKVPLQGNVFTAERRPNTYRFHPQPDITAYELAQIWAMSMATADFLPALKPFLDSAPANVRRHWLPPQPEKTEN